MGKLGKEVKGAVKEAAKYKGPSGTKKGKKGSSSGADNAKWAASRSCSSRLFALLLGPRS